MFIDSAGSSEDEYAELCSGEAACGAEFRDVGIHDYYSGVGAGGISGLGVYGITSLGGLEGTAGWGGVVCE